MLHVMKAQCAARDLHTIAPDHLSVRFGDMRRLLKKSRFALFNANIIIIITIVNMLNCLCVTDRLVGLVVKASASRAEGPGFESRLRRDFFGVESYQ